MEPNFHPRRRRAKRIFLVALLDVLLLPLAVVLVLFEDVFWRAAQKLLRGLDRAPTVRALHAWVAGLPAAAVLPLFLMPEAISHGVGFFSAFLLAKGHLATAVLLLVLVKGSATLAVVWIYQAASTTLLAIGWFARGHDMVQFVRVWALRQVAPLRQALQQRWIGKAKIPAIARRRLRAMRLRLEALFKGRRGVF